MKCEIERMEINYTFYFFPFLKSEISFRMKIDKRL